MCHQQRTPNRNGPSRSRKSFVSPMAPGVSPILHYCRKREHSRPLAAGELIYPLFRLDIFDFVRQRIIMHWPRIQRPLAALAAPALKPGDGVLNPVRLIALWIIIINVGPAAFLPVDCALDRAWGLSVNIF